MGVRKEGGFIGGHTRDGKIPEPVHISARHEDLADLLEGIALYEARALEGGVDPMAVAAALSFGFAYIHPFEDGNGRLHRYLLHHVLARGGYNPAGLVFPISVVVYRRAWWICSGDLWSRAMANYLAVRCARNSRH